MRGPQRHENASEPTRQGAARLGKPDAQVNRHAALRKIIRKMRDSNALKSRIPINQILGNGP